MEDNKFIIPTKRVQNAMMLSQWKNSKGFDDIMSFILLACEKVKGKKMTDEIKLSPNAEHLVKFLEVMKGWVAEIPPVTQPQRFGNVSFKTWLQRLDQESPNIMKNVIGSDELWSRGIWDELSVYWMESFGNSTRIDYGTGHELCFVTFIIALVKVKVLPEEDLSGIVLKIFPAYLDVMHELQTVYWLEPAGSKGAWGLDDYQFIPFIWGSAQLIGNGQYEPSSLKIPEEVTQGANDFLFLASIQFIGKMKSGRFQDHAPMLYSIADTVPTWKKVNRGLVEMYRREVLYKFPVIQHVFFGSIISFDPKDETSVKKPFVMPSKMGQQ